jgi:hypothetical protein
MPRVPVDARRQVSWMEAAARDLDAGRPVGSGVEWRVGDRYVMKGSWPTIRTSVDVGSAPSAVEPPRPPKSPAEMLWPNMKRGA